MGHNLTTFSRGSRVVDLRSEMTRLRSNNEEERRTREQLGQMLTKRDQEVKTLEARSRDWVIKRNAIQFTRSRNQELGKGAWGIVYRGKFHCCDVAVKEMHADIMSERNRHLFEREVYMASRCRHPCLLQFIGATTDERPLLVTEIMERSLRERLYGNDPRLSQQEITVISLDVAKGLNYLHQKPDPIIHHDISSANVLLWRQGNQWRAKVSDYGTANFVRQSNINYAGAAIYCAPESLNEDPNQPISCKVSILQHHTKYDTGLIHWDIATVGLPLKEVQF